MLNRSLFEDMVDAHWIATEPDAATQRYSDHHEHAQMLLADAVRKYPVFFAEAEIPEFDEAERRRLESLYTKHGTRQWSTLSLHDRTDLIAHHWRNDAERTLFRFMRDFEHKDNNQTLHVSAASLNAAVAGLVEGGTTFHLGPRPDKVRNAMYGAFWTFAQTLGLVIDHFGVPIDDNDRADMFNMRRFYDLTEEQCRGVSRNDPCPCGSGLKYKRCHGD